MSERNMPATVEVLSATEVLAINNLLGLICHKTQTNKNSNNYKK